MNTKHPDSHRTQRALELAVTNRDIKANLESTHLQSLEAMMRSWGLGRSGGVSFMLHGYLC